jgi:phage terminase Nu1 subunit (DNA packaging protein)
VAYYTLDDVGRAVGVSTPTIKRWKAKGCPGLDSAPYDVDAVRAWKEIQVREYRAQPNNEMSLSEEKTRADIELKKLKKRLHEYDLALKEGKLMLVQDSLDSHQRMANEIKKHLTAVPAKWADTIRHIDSIADAKGILTQIVDDVLGVLSRG